MLNSRTCRKAVVLTTALLVASFTLTLIVGTTPSLAGGRTLWGSSGVPLWNSSSASRIVSDGAGGAYVVWDNPVTSSVYNVWVQRVNADGTLAWGDPKLVTSAGASMKVQIVTDGSGGAIIGWVNTGYDKIYAQKISADGINLWASNAVVCGAAGSQRYEIRMVSDGSGGAFFEWQDCRTSYWKIYAQHILSNGSPKWAANGVDACTTATTQVTNNNIDGCDKDCMIVPDGAGGAIVGFYFLGGTGGGRWLTWSQRLRATDGARLWSDMGLEVGPDPPGGNWQNDRFTMTSDGAGGAIFAVDAVNPNQGAGDIWAVRCGTAW